MDHVVDEKHANLHVSRYLQRHPLLLEPELPLHACMCRLVAFTYMQTSRVVMVVACTLMVVLA